VGFERVFLLVLDGAGVGGAPDAAAFGDSGSDTIGNVLRQQAALGRQPLLPTLTACGLGNLYAEGLPGLPRGAAAAHHLRLTEVSAGKDTTTGHWEMLGLPRDAQSPTFPQGFPQALLDSIGAAAGVEWLGNRVASGTVIIQELGAEHLASGKLIVYTSADSVFQVAAHVERVPLVELYRVCELARRMLSGPFAVDRVIARPFSGSAETGFVRTPDRKDYSLAPPGPTVLDELCAAGLTVISVGKISDIFAGKGITRSYPVHGNTDVGQQLISLAQPSSQWRGLCFANFVDFDMQYGHRNDAAGFLTALEHFDTWLSAFLRLLRPSDLLFITADHGNDPTTASTDHSREQVPLLIQHPGLGPGQGRLLSVPPGFYHVGASAAAALGVASQLPGENLLAGLHELP